MTMAGHEPECGRYEGRPDYKLYAASRSPSLYACTGCGSIIHNMRIHDAWHRRLAAVIEKPSGVL